MARLHRGTTKTTSAYWQFWPTFRTQWTERERVHFKLELCQHCVLNTLFPPKNLEHRGNVERNHVCGITYGNVFFNCITSKLQGVHQGSGSNANMIQKLAILIFFFFHLLLTAKVCSGLVVWKYPIQSYANLRVEVLRAQNGKNKHSRQSVS